MSYFVLADDAQDWEESLTIWGVYGSFDEAKNDAENAKAIHSKYRRGNDREVTIFEFEGSKYIRSWIKGANDEKWNLAPPDWRYNVFV